MGFDDLLGDEEAQARAAAVFIGALLDLVELVEYEGEVLFGYADPGVGALDRYRILFFLSSGSECSSS